MKKRATPVFETILQLAIVLGGLSLMLHHYFTFN